MRFPISAEEKLPELHKTHPHCISPLIFYCYKTCDTSSYFRPPWGKRKIGWSISTSWNSCWVLVKFKMLPFLERGVICSPKCKGLPGRRAGPRAGKHCRVRMVRMDEEGDDFIMEYVEIGGICDDAKAEGRHKLSPGPAAVWARLWLQPCWGPCQGFLLGWSMQKGLPGDI